MPGGLTFHDLEDHDGYTARRLPDGTITSIWTRDVGGQPDRPGEVSSGSPHGHVASLYGRLGAAIADTSFGDPSGNNVRLTHVLEFSLDRD